MAFTPTAVNPRDLFAVYNGTGAPLLPNLFVVGDASVAVDNSVKIPATSAAIVTTKGALIKVINAGEYGEVARRGVVLIKASGNITRGADLMIDTAAGKEGRVKVASGTGMVIGVAQTVGADGDLVEVSMDEAYKAA